MFLFPVVKAKIFVSSVLEDKGENAFFCGLGRLPPLLGALTVQVCQMREPSSLILVLLNPSILPGV